MAEQVGAEPLTYTVEQAAQVVGVSYSTIRRAYNGGRLKVIYLGEGQTKPRIRRSDLLQWLDAAPVRESA